jgi:hypothetical protein
MPAIYGPTKTGQRTLNVKRRVPMKSPATPTPPKRPRLPTAAEADLMSGEAFLEAFREANEAKRKKGGSDDVDLSR